LRAKALLAVQLMSNTGFPWHRRCDVSPSQSGYRFRIAARRAILERWPPALRPFAKAAMAVAWPIGSLLESLDACRWLRPDKLGGRSRVSIFFWAWAFALRHNVRPTEAIAYRLYERGSADADQWWYTWEVASLSRSLTDASARELASDKAAFADWCEAQGLRSVPTLALAGEHGWRRPFEAGTPPQRDLLLKPSRGRSGLGVELWRWSNGAYSRGDRQYSSAEFVAYVLRRAATEEAILVQPFVAAHPQLQGLARSGMPAARVVTARDPEGRVELGLGMLQSPLAGEVASNGGTYRLIDVANGQLSAATARQSAAVFDVPLGEGFEGIHLPDWAGVVSTLVRAHERFPGAAPIIGWDVLFGAEGPLICEANLEISCYFFQQAEPLPMTSTSIGRVVEAWI
jgi:hypothetical protein